VPGVFDRVAAADHPDELLPPQLPDRNHEAAALRQLVDGAAALTMIASNGACARQPRVPSITCTDTFR